MGSLEDMQHICNCKKKMKNKNGKEIPAPSTPARYSRKNKRGYKNIQSEEDQKMACIEDNTMNRLNSLCESFPIVVSA